MDRWRRLAWISCLLFCTALLPASVGLARQSAGLLRRGVVLCERAQFSAAREALEKALAAGDLTPDEKADGNFYLGLIYLAYENKAKALEHFGAAKKADPAYKPLPGQPPHVMKLWRQAQPTTSSSQASPPIQPTAGAAPPRNIMWLYDGNLMVDLGRKQGAKVGDKLEVIKIIKIPRPGGGYISDIRRIAILEVTDVLGGGSITKLVRGKNAELIEELNSRPEEARYLPIRKLKKTPSDRDQNRESNKIVVLPPGIKRPDINYGPLGWPDDYSPEKVAEYVAQVPDLPGEVQGISRQKWERLHLSYQPFTISDFLKEAGSVESLRAGIVHGRLGDLWNPPLTKKQTKVLAKILTKLNAKYALVWGFYFETPDQQGKVVVCLFEKDKKEPILTGTAQVAFEDIVTRYPMEVEDIVGLYYSPPGEASAGLR